MRHIYDTRGKDGAAQAREQAGVDPVAQTIELCRALFGSGKFETVFGDPTTFPMFKIAMQMMDVCFWLFFFLVRTAPVHFVFY